MLFEDIKSLISTSIPDSVKEGETTSSPERLVIGNEFIYQVCELLHGNEKTYFDSLSCLTGLDNGPEENTMEVIYNLYSIPHNLHLMLSVTLDRNQPEVDSVTSIWGTANWHEREAYDLLGIHFKNHPDLRRILLPIDWEGHPLKKDYVEQEMYHEVKVKY